VSFPLETYYLIDAEAAREGVKLRLYNASTDAMEEVLDTRYRPYFFVPHPTSQGNEEAVRGMGAKTSTVEKQNLFTGKTERITRVELREISDPRRASERFEGVWEGEVPLTLGYAYDQGLTFGAQHVIHGEKIETVFAASEEKWQRFRDMFSEIEGADPKKYELLERWFALCSQPVPEIVPERLGIGGRVDPERYYLAFILSRVANLPVPEAYSSRQVSAWIRSILHNHLRRRNILIPTSRELRKGETKRSVQGALTFPPKSGTYFNTVVTDFESLYPSIIDTYNLSYETVDCHHEECEGNRVPGLEHHVCQRRRGVYSVLMGSIKDLRIHWFKPLSRDNTISAEDRRLAQATSQLLKLILVSSYGVTVRIHGLARPALAESITAYGRHILRKSWDIAQGGGLHPIYGDTDSLFLDNPTDAQVGWLIKTVKDQLRVDLAVDKQYSVCVLPTAMKAYFGIRGDGTPDIKGVTAIKSNSPAFIQNVFNDCVKALADAKNWDAFETATRRIQEIVRRAIRDLKAGKIPLKDLEYPVELHFDPAERVGDEEETLHQPYQCAAQLLDSGKDVRRGETVAFVKVKPFSYRGKTFTVKPTEHVRGIHEVNVEDYVRNLTTALNQTFKPMNIRFQAEREATLADFV